MRRREAIQTVVAAGVLIVCGVEGSQAEEQPRKDMVLVLWGLHGGFVGEHGALRVEEGLLVCEERDDPFKYPPGGRSYHPQEFVEVKSQLMVKGRVSVEIPRNEKAFLAIDAEGRVIATDVLNDAAKWEVTRDGPLGQKLLREHFNRKDDEVAVYRVAHQTGHKGKRYLTTAGVESKNDASLKELEPNRIVLTADKNAAVYLWNVTLSGK